MRKAVLPGVIVFLFAVSLASLAGAKDWELFFVTPPTNAYYDRDGMHRSPQGIVKVWYRVVNSQRERRNVVSKLRQTAPGVDWDGYKESRYQVAIDCEDRKMSNRYSAHYHENMYALAVGKYEVRWEPIPPKSMMEELYKEVCPDTEKK
jgi:hypothetical protein